MSRKPEVPTLQEMKHRGENALQTMKLLIADRRTMADNMRAQLRSHSRLAILTVSVETD